MLSRPQPSGHRRISPNVLHVLKRWAAWPRGIRWLAGVLAVAVLAVVIAW
jgi:hypothetical protein